MPLQSTCFPNCTHADTPVKFQVRLENLGNTILRGAYVAVAEVTDLACKMGDATAIDDTILAGNTDATTATDVPPKMHVVCIGSFTFNQTELDVDQASKSFTPVLHTTSTGVTQTSTGFTPYATSASTPISSAPSMVVWVNATACVIPSILPPDANSKRSSVTHMRHPAAEFCTCICHPVRHHPSQPADLTSLLQACWPGHSACKLQGAIVRHHACKFAVHNAV